MGIQFRNVVLQSLLCTSFFAHGILAQEQIWTNASGGDLLDAANWNSDVPDDTEAARFDLGFNYEINLTTDHTIGSWLQDDGEVTLTGGSNLNVAGASSIFGGALILDGSGTQFNQTGQLEVVDGAIRLRNGAALSSDTGRIGQAGQTDGATATVGIDGEGSQWIVASNLLVGGDGSGLLAVQNGGLLSLGTSLGVGGSESGSVFVFGSGSRLISAANSSEISNGSLRIEDQGSASFANMRVGVSNNGVFVVDGESSSMTVSGVTTVGASTFGVMNVRDDAVVTAGSILELGTASTGQGTINVQSGGTLTSNLSRVGRVAGSEGEVNVTGNGSQWNVTNQLFVGSSGTGNVSVTNGGKTMVDDAVRIGSSSGSIGSMTIDGTGSELTAGGLDVGYRGDGTLSVSNGGVVASQFANLGSLADGTGSATVSGPDSRWDVTTSLDIGALGEGSLTISNGGAASAEETNVSQSSGSTGNLLITGQDSQLVTDFATSAGTVAIDQGGLLQTNTRAGIGGTASVTGAGSQWLNDDDVTVTGDLTIASGGTFTSGATAYIGSAGTNGSVVVEDAGSTWTGDQGLAIGRLGTGSLEVRGGGVVSNQFTSVGADGGSGSLLVDGVGSQLNTSNFSVGAFGDGIATIANGGLIDTSFVSIRSDENGSLSEMTVTGTGSSLNNSGELRVGDFDRTGQLNILDGGAVNTDSTRVYSMASLRLNDGVFSSATQVENFGLVEFSGNSELNGGISLIADGRVETIDSASAIVHGSISLNDSEVFTELGSSIRFTDDVSGTGDFSGLGLVEFDGLVDPGSASNLPEFDGHVNFLSDSLLRIELAGTGSNLFDQLLFDGNLALTGDLSVDLVNGFELEEDMEFLIADVGGNLLGQFSGLAESSLVGNFGGQDLFISYSGGNGNDIRLFTSSAIPEPGAAMLIVLAGTFFVVRRKRNLIRPASFDRSK
jgi:T5SS/PEP-CTERM-associated repeat protein